MSHAGAPINELKKKENVDGLNLESDRLSEFIKKSLERKTLKDIYKVWA